MNEEDIFAKALEISDQAKRQEFLDEACAGDRGLRQSVEELLEMSDLEDDFLETPAMGESHPLDEVQPNAVIGRYRLIERVGEGGFGEVWKAEQREPVQRTVALKIIKPGMDTRQVIARFSLRQTSHQTSTRPSAMLGISFMAKM